MGKLELGLAEAACWFALVTQCNVIGLIGIDGLNLPQSPVLLIMQTFDLFNIVLRTKIKTNPSSFMVCSLEMIFIYLWIIGSNCLGSFQRESCFSTKELFFSIMDFFFFNSTPVPLIGKCSLHEERKKKSCDSPL